MPLKTFDSQVEAGLIALDGLGLVWIDAQGHEGHILTGARSLHGADVPVLIEFWPYGLERAGGTEMLVETVGASFATVIDMGDGSELPARRLAELLGRYRGTEDTDLLLLPRARPGRGPETRARRGR